MSFRDKLKSITVEKLPFDNILHPSLPISFNDKSNLFNLFLLILHMI